MRCGTFVFTLEFVVTLPNDTSVLGTIRIPYLGAEEPAAVSANEL